MTLQRNKEAPPACRTFDRVADPVSEQVSGMAVKGEEGWGLLFIGDRRYLKADVIHGPSLNPDSNKETRKKFFFFFRNQQNFFMSWVLDTKELLSLLLF